MSTAKSIVGSDAGTLGRQNLVQVAASGTTKDRRRTGIFLQDACFLHRFIRSKTTSGVFERPERLRAVMVGLSAALARLELGIAPPAASNVTDRGTPPQPRDVGTETATEELEVALGRMTLNQQLEQPSFDGINPALPVTIVKSQASLDLLNHPAVKYVHGDVEKDVYLENLVQWTKDSSDKIAIGESEIPAGLSQGDLYLCPQSLDAIQGALGTVCEAVDRVMASRQEEKSLAQSPLEDAIQRAFVAIRPPGHHCGEDTPSGFCFVNNVAVAAAHAHLQHGVRRIVIFDIDLHHGNGTQSIVWQINEETYRQTLEKESGGKVKKMGPRIFYGSIHDILSYPCEDGKVELVQAASVSIHNAHGQYIENVHLELYNSEEEFWEVLYKYKYSPLLKKAEEFIAHTGGPSPDDVLVFISCGMDACEHEYKYMSRHGRKVPTSFYHQFTRDACAFSDRLAGGRIISVLEGGYNDRALISGTLAHIAGLVTAHNDDIDDKVDRTWWDVDNLVMLEKSTKQGQDTGRRKSLQNKETMEKWLARTIAILSSVDTGAATSPSSSRRSSAPPPKSSSMTLRDRGKKGKETTPARSSPSSPSRSNQSTKVKNEAKQKTGKLSESLSAPSVHAEKHGGNVVKEGESVKKLPRVILRLKPES